MIFRKNQHPDFSLWRLAAAGAFIYFYDRIYCTTVRNTNMTEEELQMDVEFENDDFGLDPDLLTADELGELSVEELDELFAGADVPEEDELDGTASVLWLAGPAASFVPEPLRKVRAALAASPVFPWKGMEFEKSFDDDTLTGKNVFFNVDSGPRLFDFEARVDSSEFDGADCLVFDYDVEGNFLIFKQLRDEVRKLNSSLYLGRGNIVLGGEPRFIAYFSIEPV